MPKSKYARSRTYRLSTAMMRRRNPLSPAELEDRDVLSLVVKSDQAADRLIETFGSLKALAQFGAENGFTRLLGYPGVTPNVVGYLEGWLESIGRVTAA